MGTEQTLGEILHNSQEKKLDTLMYILEDFDDISIICIMHDVASEVDM